MRCTTKTMGNVLLSLLVMALTLLLAEVLWRQVMESGDKPRQFTEQLRFVNPPNAEWVIRKKDYTTHIRTNSLGFRGPEMPAEPKGNELRVLFLGDSFTEAKQVEEEERFAERVGTLLQERTGREVVTRALAIGGANPALELIYYREIGREFDPDIVVQVLFPENDLLPKEGPYAFREEGGQLTLEDVWVEPAPPCPWKCKLLRHSALLRATYHTLRNAGSEQENAAANLGDYFWYTAEGQEQLEEEGRWQVLQSLVRTLQQEVEQDGARFLALLMPSGLEMQPAWQEEYLSEHPLSQNSWQISNLLSTAYEKLQSAGVHVFDLRFAFLVLSTSPDDFPLYYKSDPHLSLRGNEVIANAVAGVLLRTK